MEIKVKDIVIDRRKKVSIEEQVICSLWEILQSARFIRSNSLPHPEKVAHFYNIPIDEIMNGYHYFVTNGYIHVIGSDYILKPIVFNSQFYSRIIPLFDQILASGKEPSFHIINQHIGKKLVIKQFNELYKLENYMFSRRLFKGNNIPIVVYDSYINLAVIDYQHISSNEPLYRQLLELGNIQLSSSNRIIESIILPTEISILLNAPPKSVGFKVSAQTYNQYNQLVEVFIGYASSFYHIIY